MEFDREQPGPPSASPAPDFIITTAQEWRDAITWIRANGYPTDPGGPDAYLITIAGDSDIFVLNENRYENLPNTFGSFQGTITLNGSGTLSLESDPADALNTDGDGAIIYAGPGQTIILGGPTFKGKNPNSYPVVYFSSPSGGGIIMNAGKITGGNNWGAGIDSGTFRMTGGTIEGNGAGVSISGGKFIMSSGTIEGNGAGVFITGGEFIMSGTAVISNGNVGVSVANLGGGNGGIFTMLGGTISHNVNVGVGISDSTFRMAGGTISYNGIGVESAGAQYGNGAYFEMLGGTISHNSTIGVKIDGPLQNSYSYRPSNFTMSGGTISYNGDQGLFGYGWVNLFMSGGVIKYNEDGGAFVSRESHSSVSANFTMTGGTITGNHTRNTYPGYAGGVTTFYGNFNLYPPAVSGLSGNVTGNTLGNPPVPSNVSYAANNPGGITSW